MTTLDEVARQSGVSPSTVSRYLRGKLALREETEQRIQDAVAALGYVGNASARSLAAQRSGVVGLVLPGLSNPFFAALADSIADEVARHDLSLLLCTTRDVRQREEDYTNLLEGQAVDGMLYLGAHPSNRRLGRVIKRGLPVVVVDEPQEQLPPVTTLTVDNFTGGFQATSHLLDLGHRRIFYLGGPAKLGTEHERRRGYSEALTRAGIDTSADLALSGSYTETFGVSALPHILTGKVQATAVFCASDHMALGLMSAAHVHGVQIPDDLSVVGFDDIQLAKYTTPGLTSVRQPVQEISHTAVEMLVSRMNNPAAAPEARTLPVELIVRGSSQRIGPAVADGPNSAWEKSSRGGR
ncbi:LacI family DNA-binding transcriptional regulator [Flexivirga caeni]|uniref:LacI family transcriptional regulator n=1 Tax=Flexivirga caeni TaxID=2294115 RepID=A0A3M9MFH0_9MICO|nr:LacI family DNA-binding transcriptional regulator [Flexivirga caeni]RNI24244.1 LacI family transcriptional regulator [Flexivirga caeni]